MHTIAWGLKSEQGVEPPDSAPLSLTTEYNKTVCDAVWAGRQGSKSNTNNYYSAFLKFLKSALLAVLLKTGKQTTKTD